MRADAPSVSGRRLSRARAGEGKAPPGAVGPLRPAGVSRPGHGPAVGPGHDGGPRSELVRTLTPPPTVRVHTENLPVASLAHTHTHVHTHRHICTHPSVPQLKDREASARNPPGGSSRSV